MGVIASEVKLDWTKAQEFKNGVVKKLIGGVEGLLKGNKVDIVKGEAYFVDANTVRVINGDSSSNLYIQKCNSCNRFSSSRNSNIQIH